MQKKNYKIVSNKLTFSFGFCFSCYLKPIRFFLIIFFFCVFTMFSQNSASNKQDKLSYFKKITRPNDNTKNHLFTFGYQYMLSPIGKTFGAQGTISNFGVNFARLFSHKVIIGLTIDLKLIKGFTNKKLSNEFISDFNQNFNKNYTNTTDSVNAYVVKNAINQGPSQFLRGNNSSNIGIMFSLLPQKYGGILLQVKSGFRTFGVTGVNGIKEINEGANDVVSIEIPADWVYEITFKPLAFFRDTYVKSIEDIEGESIANRFTISLFYEKLSFKSAKFNGTSIRQMTSETFMNKYNVDNRFGFKLGFCFY